MTFTLREMDEMLEAAKEFGRREVLREVATVEPVYIDDFGQHCTFCGMDEASCIADLQHAPGCLWLRAQAAIEIK